MATRVHIGAKDLRGAITAYAKRFDLLEVTVAVGAKGAQAGQVTPGAATLRKWRKEVPPHFDFSVVAGPQLSRLKAGAGFDAELGAARAAIDVLRARCFIVRTPPDVTPGQVWRDRLGKLFAQFPKDVTHVVWEPSGVWEIEAAAVAARGWGVVLAVDAAQDPVPGGPVAYVRLRALGETRSFGPSALTRIAKAIGDRNDAYVVLETESALEEAKRLRDIAQRSKSSTGGLGRLVRPRGSIVVRDDEQE